MGPEGRYFIVKRYAINYKNVINISRHYIIVFILKGRTFLIWV
jgi:hypothetical protein